MNSQTQPPAPAVQTAPVRRRQTILADFDRLRPTFPELGGVTVADFFWLHNLPARIL